MLQGAGSAPSVSLLLTSGALRPEDEALGRGHRCPGQGWESGLSGGREHLSQWVPELVEAEEAELLSILPEI